MYLRQRTCLITSIIQLHLNQHIYFGLRATPTFDLFRTDVCCKIDLNFLHSLPCRDSGTIQRPFSLQSYFVLLCSAKLEDSIPFLFIICDYFFTLDFSPTHNLLLTKFEWSVVRKFIDETFIVFKNPGYPSFQLIDNWKGECFSPNQVKIK